jgi:hypothetical protein
MNPGRVMQGPGLGGSRGLESLQRFLYIIHFMKPFEPVMSHVSYRHVFKISCRRANNYLKIYF